MEWKVKLWSSVSGISLEWRALLHPMHGMFGHSAHSTLFIDFIYFTVQRHFDHCSILYGYLYITSPLLHTNTWHFRTDIPSHSGHMFSMTDSKKEYEEKANNIEWTSIATRNRAHTHIICRLRAIEKISRTVSKFPILFSHSILSKEIGEI